MRIGMRFSRVGVFARYNYLALATMAMETPFQPGLGQQWWHRQTQQAPRSPSLQLHPSIALDLSAVRMYRKRPQQ
jgi:hypothetical protein